MDINKIEQIYNGPIINMLKRQVDNYKKNWRDVLIIYFQYIYLFFNKILCPATWNYYLYIIPLKIYYIVSIMI